MAKVISLAEATGLVHDGASVMGGGFILCGVPLVLFDALAKTPVSNLTTISNDTGTPEGGISRLIAARKVKKVITSHVGLNPETGQQMNAGELEVELVPQGTLAERIRAGGSGLGGILTPTGVGTAVAEGKQILKLNGTDYLLEMPLRANVALLHAWRADSYGNLQFRGTARNFNPLMAMAADTVIVQVEELVEGALDPDAVHTPAILVDYLVKL